MCAKYKTYIKENILIQSLIMTLICFKYSISLWDSILASRFLLTSLLLIFALICEQKTHTKLLY